MKEKKSSKWWVLWVTTSGTSLVFLDTSVMPVALPTIQNELLFSAVGIVWVINAYLLSLTSLLLIGGRLTDLLGKRFLFILGLTFFGIASLIAGCALNHWMLILGRVIQGIGGALMIPTTGALLIATFPQGERAKAIGINTGISGLFLIIGPAIGGFLTQYVSWRSIFFLNIPLVIFGIVMACNILKKEIRRHETFHLRGALVLIAALMAFVIGLMQASEWGWQAEKVWILLIVSPLLFTLFIWMSKHQKHPIVDLKLFKQRDFSVAALCIFISQIIVMNTVLWAIYFQEEIHYSPSETGMMIFLACLPVLLIAPFGGYLSDRFGARLPLLIGFGTLVFSLLWFYFTARTAESITFLLPGLLSFGAAMPLIMSPTVAMALSQANPEKLGQASGMSVVVRQLAATIGMAVMTAIFEGAYGVTHSYTEAFRTLSLVSSGLAIVGFLVAFTQLRLKTT